MNGAKETVDWVALSILRTGSYFDPLWWKVSRTASEPELFVQPHGKFDGVGWFAHLIQQEYGVRLDNLPAMPGARPSPPLWKLLWSALRCAKAVWLDPSAARWKNFSLPAAADSDGNPLCRAWLVLTREESDHVREIARENKVSLNALALWAMNRALQDSLLPDSGPMIWSIPVNMRGCITLGNPNANHVSGVEACTPVDATPSQIYEALLSEFRNNSHWVAWHTLTMGKWLGSVLGPWLFELVALRKSRRLTGSFSYLGSWPPPGMDVPGVDDAWCCTSIARLERPIGVGMLTWHGKMSVGLIAHPSVSRDPSQAAHWLSNWKSHILDSPGNKAL